MNDDLRVGVVGVAVVAIVIGAIVVVDSPVSDVVTSVIGGAASERKSICKILLVYVHSMYFNPKPFDLSLHLQ